VKYENFGMQSSNKPALCNSTYEMLTHLGLGWNGGRDAGVKGRRLCSESDKLQNYVNCVNIIQAIN
jgi:hypothetical protein